MSKPKYHEVFAGDDGQLLMYCNIWFPYRANSVTRVHRKCPKCNARLKIPAASVAAAEKEK